MSTINKCTKGVKTQNNNNNVIANHVLIFTMLFTNTTTPLCVEHSIDNIHIKGHRKKNRKKKRRRFFKTFHKWSTHTNTNTFLSFKLVDISCLKNAGYTRLYGQRFFFCAPFFLLFNKPSRAFRFFSLFFSFFLLETDIHLYIAV